MDKCAPMDCELEGWKAIADFMNRSRSVVHRWSKPDPEDEEYEPMPVYRLHGTVYASKAELREWVKKHQTHTKPTQDKTG